jgi:hypothetical protein
MKNKNLIGLLVVLGVLLAAVASKKIFEGQRTVVEDIAKEKETVATLTQNLLPEAIGEVVLYKGAEPDKKIEIKRGEKNTWFLPSRYGIRAREEALTPFLKGLSNLSGSVRATSKSVFSDFMIGDKEGLHVILKNIAGKDVAHLVIGLSVPRWGVNFMRRADAEKVVMIEGENLLATLGLYTPKDNLEDRSIGDYHVFSGDVKKAERLEIAISKKESYVLAKSDTWNFEPSDPRAKIEQPKIDEFLRILSDMLGRDVVDPNGTGYGLEQPLAIAKVTLREGDQVKVLEAQLGGPVAQEGMSYVRVLPANIVFKVPDNAALNLKQSKAYFLQATPKKK